MSTQEWIDYVVSRGEELTLQKLSDPSTYPDKVFVDYETYEKHQSRGIERSSKHLIEEWVVKFQVRDNRYMSYIITNKKEVGGWNLLQLLERGTNFYESKNPKGMTFWNRYAKKWFFKLHARKGIGQEYVDLINDMQHEIVAESVVDAIVEANDKRVGM
jgi:hypothetical protein